MYCAYDALVGTAVNGCLVEEGEVKKPKSFMDLAMEKLRKDMTEIAEQDVVLMKTMLRMSRTIEEIKIQHIYDDEYEDEEDDECDLEEDSDMSVSNLTDSEDELDNTIEQSMYEILPRIGTQRNAEKLKASDEKHSVYDSGYEGESSDCEGSDNELS